MKTQADPESTAGPETTATADTAAAASFTREDVEFRSMGTCCAAWLYRPERANPPVVVMAHGLGGIREARLDSFAERFARAGFAALVFDYRFFGSSDGQPRQLLTMRNQQEDWHAAIEFARRLEGVDTNRVAVWGTSLAGGHVMQVAARDDRLAAVVSQCPFTDGLASVRTLNPLAALGVGLLGLLDRLGALFGRRPLLVPLTGPPVIPALMTKPDVIQGLVKLLPPGSQLSGRLSKLFDRFVAKRLTLPSTVTRSTRPEPFRASRVVGSVYMPSGTALVNGVSARFGLEITFARPGRALRKVKCPTLVCICDQDSVAPPQRTAKFVKHAPHAEARHYDAGHFDIYVGERFERVVADQIEFLGRVLG